MTRKLSACMTCLTLVVLSIVTGHPVVAGVSGIVEELPLTQIEQATRLSNLTSYTIQKTLLSESGQVGLAPYFQRDYRAQWMQATINDRIGLAERIGNQGRARFASEQGWTKIVGSQNRGIVQGPDSVYWDAQTGTLRALEDKGGTSAVKWTYNSWQGTNKNVIRSAEFTLKSTKTTAAEKVAAARVIEAAKGNRLQTGVIRSEHSLGRPNNPGVDGGWSAKNVAKEAASIERKLIKQDPALEATFGKARAAQNADMLKYRLKQGMAVVGLLGAGTIGFEAYQETQLAYSMWYDPSLQGSLLPYLQTGLAGGKWASGITLGLGSVAQLGGGLGQTGLGVVCRTAGDYFLPISVGVELITVGMAYCEYSNGVISMRDFDRKLTGAGIFLTSTAAGAGAGAFFGGVGAIPGAAIGATVGAVGQGVAQLHWYFVDKQFNEQQREQVDRALERHYGLIQ